MAPDKQMSVIVECYYILVMTLSTKNTRHRRSAASNARSAHSANVQLTLDDARKPTGHGGWRPRSGRPKGRTGVTHDARPDFAPRYPVHVTWRLMPDIPSLRRQQLVDIIRTAIGEAQRASFGVVEYAVMSNHMHYIIEAGGKKALGNGLKGLGRRLTARLNKKLGRSGRLFETRYHARVLKSPREVKNALRYVLLNARHHAAEGGNELDEGWIDPFSSGIWFDGWAQEIDPEWNRGLLEQPKPTVKARTWLLAVGWRRWGLLEFDEVPG